MACECWSDNVEIGKISNELLEKIIFSKIKYRHPDVLVGSGMAEDCSLVSFKDEICVISTDPITATANNIGKLSVIVSGNDVATKGIKPFAIMITLLIPPESSIEEIIKVIEDIVEVTNDMEVELIGGHTEVTDAVNRIVISATSFGKAELNKVVYGKKVLPGDKIIVTKSAACEGTVILYDDFRDTLGLLITKNDINEIEMLRNTLSVCDDGVIAGERGAKYMHDVTEGGILGAVWETATKFGLGAFIYKEDIPILKSTEKITKYFNIDPLKLISSGMMLIVANENDTIEILKELKNSDIEGKVIGEFTKKDCLISSKAGIKKISPPKGDDLYKVYSENIFD